MRRTRIGFCIFRLCHPLPRPEGWSEIENSLSNITYEIWTNSSLTASSNWGLWQTIVATSSNALVATIDLTTNSTMFFEGQMVWSQGIMGCLIGGRWSILVTWELIQPETRQETDGQICRSLWTD